MVFNSTLGSFLASGSIVINNVAVELAVPWRPCERVREEDEDVLLHGKKNTPSVSKYKMF
jgi:hypothetical protein